ncbi:G-protein coupled receptor Mth2-like [Musca autumnalis]|uniref:G-protein coupled receptor Mth2-like n=1 Tax=Musca autumnalis TaxID=221902 RepID=UPI003CE96A09
MAKGHIISVVIFTLAILIITCIGIFVIPALIARESKYESKPTQCNFRDTVNLTNRTRLKNGSYLYNGVEIPENQTAFYNYTQMFRYKQQPAEKHLRGCICDESKGRFCTKLCCERGDFFNQTSRRCEKLAKDSPNEMEIQFMNDTHKNINIFDHFIIQIGKPCDKLEVISMKVLPWILMENGDLVIESEKFALDTVNYCISPQYDNKDKKHKLTVMSCPIRNDSSLSMVLNSYSMAVSVAFFALTIILYLVVDRLHNTMPGKLQTCYLIALAAGYSTIGYINIARAILPVVPCRVVGFSGYYFFMSAYLWLAVLCFNMYKTVKEWNTLNASKRETWIRFIIYSTFVWGTAGIFTLILIWAQLSNVVPESYKPNIGYNMCWLDTHKWTAALYFYIPNCLIMVFNIFAFVQVTMVIYTVKRNVSIYEANKKKHLQENVFMILRLFLLMGILWIMDIISYCCRNYKFLAFIFDVTDFCNASQGVLIFFLFICRREVLNAINEQFHIRKRSPNRGGNQMLPTKQAQLSGTSGTAATPPTTFITSLSPFSSKI